MKDDVAALVTLFCFCGAVVFTLGILDRLIGFAIRYYRGW